MEKITSPLPANRRWENAHIALWLCKDTCWILNVKILALTMAAPTLALAIAITWQFRKSRTELVHNLAVCCWITGNVVWMVGEFYHDDMWRPYAQWFFFGGLGIVGVYYARALFRRVFP